MTFRELQPGESWRVVSVGDIMVAPGTMALPLSRHYGRNHRTKGFVLKSRSFTVIGRINDVPDDATARAQGYGTFFLHSRHGVLVAVMYIG